jgi:hypothetical protein
VAGVALLAIGSTAQGVVIDFTGGTLSAGDTHYEENGFQIDAVGGDMEVGDYYGVGNDVLHAHWIFGLTELTVSKIGGGTFDLNYFIITSNTHTGGGTASGTEQTYITRDGGLDPILLPAEDWGFPATQIFLPSSYDNISSFSFHSTNDVFCFGMDEFYINEAAPASSGVPDGGGSVVLMGLALLGVGAVQRKAK